MAKRGSNGNGSSSNRSDPYAPDPRMKFTFGLWTVGNVGRD